jgi:hypothetical protein
LSCRSDTKVAWFGEVEIIFDERTFLATGENVDDMRVFAVVEKREEDFDGTDTAVEAGRQRGF